MNNINLRLDFYERTKELNFSEELDDFLEEDYVKNHGFYTDDVISNIALWYTLLNHLEPEELIESIKASVCTWHVTK